MTGKILSALLCSGTLLTLCAGCCTADAKTEEVSATRSGEPVQAGTKFRQVYPLDTEKAAENAVRIENALKKVQNNWKTSPAVYFITDAMSAVKQMPDQYPEDGKFLGELGIVAAKGEYEPASIVFYPMQNVDKLTLKVSSLKNAKGAEIAPDAVDLKLVKLWYQSGNAWSSYFADPLKHALVPELLVNDENLVQVDCNRRDNYVRYNNADGTTSYWWMTAPFTSVNYDRTLGQGQTDMIRDAETLQSVVLNKGEFKQFIATVCPPKDAQSGLYTGAIDVIADGKKIGSIPVKVRVLPFELPSPRTYDRIERPFIACFYGTATRYPKVLKNLVAHNALTPMGFPFANPEDPGQFKKDVQLARKCSLPLEYVFSAVPGCGYREKLKPNERDIKMYAQFEKDIEAASAMMKKELPDTKFYSYAIDEGDFWTIRAERKAWDKTHSHGGNVMVSTHPHGRFLNDLDYAAFANSPSKWLQDDVDKMHRTNPDALVGWYANPHSGPENPDYIRRVHGLVPYKFNFDAVSNYCWWRNNWNDFAVTDEPNLRALIMVYAAGDDVIDTLEWEGVREGLDDIRYATLLQQTAYEALKSPKMEVRKLARAALSFLAYCDQERDSANFIRMECLQYIMQLRKVLGKEVE